MDWVQKRFCDLRIGEAFKAHPRSSRVWLKLGKKTCGRQKGRPQEVQVLDDLVWVRDDRLFAGGVTLGAG